MASRTVGGHPLLLRLARGGMAEVYLAHLTGAGGFEKLVAVKRIRPELATEEELVSRFVAEARLAARISHPNVCHIVELGEEDGAYYLIMEYLEGVTLGELMEELAEGGRRRLDVRLVGALFLQACEGLHHAHELRDLAGKSLEVVHRDVSPGNLFVTVDGVLKVLDFGVAKAATPWRTRTGAIRGKFPYMSPEQIRGQRVDRRSDVFALGVVLFESVTGLGLFHRESEHETFEAVTAGTIPRAGQYRDDLPALLDAAIARALARDPAQRFPTARAFGQAVLNALAPRGGPLPLTAVGEEVRRLFGEALEARRALVARAVADREAGVDEPLAAPSPSRPGLKPVTHAVTARPVPHRRRALPALAITGTAILAAVALIAYHVGRAAPDRSPAPVPSTAPASPAPAAPAAPESEPTPVTQGGSGSAPAHGAAPTPSPGGSRRPAQRRLAPPETGWLTLDSRPWATITIDGRRIGQTPIYRLALPAGPHTVRADCSCGRSRTFTVQVEAGEASPARRLRW